MFYDQCRTCKSNKRSLISIFDEESVNDEVIMYSQMIYYCTSIQILESDKLPISICNECKSEIIKFYTFRQKTIEADAYFRTLYKIETKVDIDDNNDGDQTNFSTTAPNSSMYEQNSHFDFVTVKSEDDNYEEGTSGINNDSYLDLDNLNNLSDDGSNNDYCGNDTDSDVDTNENEIDYPHKCAICSKRFKELTDILPHVEQAHSGFMKKKSTISKTRNSKLIPKKKRTYVKSESKTNENIKKIKNVYEDTNNTVDSKSENDNVSEEKEVDLKAIKKGKRSKKTSSIESKCLECDKTFKNKSSLRKHLKTMHENDSQSSNTFSSICNICGELFTSSNKFKDHYMRHFPEQCLKCDVCNKLYTNKFRYKNHMLSHSEIKDFKCDLCDYKSATKPALTTHMRSHSDFRPFKCHVCGFGFKVRTLLVNHIAIKHTGDGAFKCVVCSKVYNRAALLNNHMLSHSDDRPYVCDTCGKAFKYSRNLKVHNKLHTGEKSHVCDLCGQNFTHLTSWQNHMTKNHPEIKIPRGRQTGVQPQIKNIEVIAEETIKTN